MGGGRRTEFVEEQRQMNAGVGPAPWSLDGKVAVVTGASSGIGRATAVLLKARGAKVLAVARNAQRLEDLRNEAEVDVLALALGAPDTCEEIMSHARRLGPVTILVNCAGLGGYLDSPIWEQSTEAWRATLQTNLDVPFELTKRVALDIREVGWGRVVMISSTAGEVGAPSQPAYCSSKHGVIGLMRATAMDLAPHGGTCNAVLPGWVRTEMADQDAINEAAARDMTVDEVWAERASDNPAKRIATTDELAEAIAFLASPASSGINGQAITVSLGSIW
jgi:NAD(P)-dependent dehydrogenase (short-subunit alcohol dehydrogenase family)